MASVLFAPDHEAYIVACDVDAHDGQGFVTLSGNEKDAKRFSTAWEAMEYWKRVSTVRPVRPDGKPNRPLSAYTVEVRTVADDGPRMPSRASTGDDEGNGLH